MIKHTLVDVAAKGMVNVIIDIGSNDGTLLKNFRDAGHNVLGVEPSNTAQLAKDAGIETMQR